MTRVVSLSKNGRKHGGVPIHLELSIRAVSSKASNHDEYTLQLLSLQKMYAMKTSMCHCSASGWQEIQEITDYRTNSMYWDR